MLLNWFVFNSYDMCAILEHQYDLTTRTMFSEISFARFSTVHIALCSVQSPHLGLCGRAEDS